MLPLYSPDHHQDHHGTTDQSSSFRIRQRASTPGTGRRRKQPGTTTWEQHQDAVTIAIPEHPIHSTTTTSSSSTPNANRYKIHPSKHPRWKVDYENHWEQETYHSVFRTPHFVTDAQYHRHLRGESLDPPNPPYDVWAAQCCSVFSFIGCLILCFIGFLLDTQALYIPGSLPSIPIQSTVDVHGTVRNSLSYEYLIPNTERLYIATTAYRTSLLYGLCSILCFYYLRRKQQYQFIPDGNLPTFVSAGTRNDTLLNRVIRRVKRNFRTRKQEKKG